MADPIAVDVAPGDRDYGLLFPKKTMLDTNNINTSHTQHVARILGHFSIDRCTSAAAVRSDSTCLASSPYASLSSSETILAAPERASAVADASFVSLPAWLLPSPLTGPSMGGPLGEGVEDEGAGDGPVWNRLTRPAPSWSEARATSLP